MLQHQNEMLEYIAANLPSRLPGDQKITTKQQPQFKAHTGYEPKRQTNKQTNKWIVRYVVKQTETPGRQNCNVFSGHACYTRPVQSETQTFRLQVKQQSVGSSDVAPVKRPSKNALMNVPKIPYLTLDEFSEVPKYNNLNVIFCTVFELPVLHRYMKNRLSYDQVNMTVDDLHRVMVAKYKLLATPRSSLGEPAMKKYKVIDSLKNISI